MFEANSFLQQTMYTGIVIILLPFSAQNYRKLYIKDEEKYSSSGSAK